MTDANVFGPDYVWESEEEYLQTMKRMSMTPYQMLREFHSTYGVPLDQKWPGTQGDELLNLRDRLLTEEFNEVMEAGSPEEMLKELADVVYIAFGTAATYGWNLDKALSRVHLSNMSKLDPDTGEPIRREDGKVLKGKNYKPPYLGDLV